MNEQKIRNSIESIIDTLTKYGVETKSGTWQANQLFEDQVMLVRRNVIFILELTEVDLDKIGADLPWAEDHFQERISGKPTNPGEAYKTWPYAKFKDGEDPYQDGKMFSHTYQERFWPKEAGYIPGGYKARGIRYFYGDLQDVINQLKENPLTRQAYLPIFFPEDTGAVHKQRVPCTLGYYFWVKDGVLYMNYTIRSCDALRHFRNDVYLTCRLLQYVAGELNLMVGEVNFIIFNFHVFKNDLFALKKKELKIWKEFHG